MSRSVYECPKSGSVSSIVCRPFASAIIVVLLVGLAGCSAELSRFDFKSVGYNTDRAGKAGTPVPSEAVGRNAGLASTPEAGYAPPSRSAAIEMAPLADPVPAYSDRPMRSAGLPPQPMTPPSDARASAYVADPAPSMSAPAHRMGTAGAGTVIEVEQGDTLTSLAKHYGVSISELMAINGLQTPSVRPGQKLTVPAGKRMIVQRSSPLKHAAAHPAPAIAPAAAMAPRAAAPVASSPPAAAHVEPLASQPPRPAAPAVQQPVATTSGADWTGTHTLASGESLYVIARRHGVKTADIQAANGITDPTKLRPGTVLKVPANAAASAGMSPLASTLSAGETLRPTIINEAARPAAEGNRVAALGVSPQSLTDASPTPTSKAEPAAAPALAAPPKIGGTGKFRWPVKGKIIAGFGPRGDGHNDGVNISVPLGTDVAAAEAGVVAYAGSELKGYGNLVLVRHDNNWVSAYAHNDQILVKRGDKVKRGQILAKAGNSGTADQPQVHFELRQGSKPVDPLPYMEKN